MPLTKRKTKDDEQSVTSETKQPIKNVPALMGEGEKFYRDQLYNKAIQCYTEVLELSPGNTNALVERSACYLKIGRNDLALADAEESLKEDRKFTKGLYQKAEALYAMGEFELALVFYHRGKKLRADMKEFQLGINKAQEAIDNCVGDPNTVKLEVKGDLSYFDRPDEGGYVKPMVQKTVIVPKREKRPTKQVNQKTIKQLLGDLYADKVYLERLLEDDRATKANTKSGDAIWSLANNGLDYLDSRTDFWRQQKPIYARRKTYGTATSSGADSIRNPLNYIIKQLEAIDQLQTNGKYQESLNKSNKLMAYVNKTSESQIADKKSIEANIYSNIGNAYLEMGNYQEALQAHQKDLDISTSIDQKDGMSRALENIGRVYARNGKYKEAIDVWEKKMTYLGDNNLEKAWLFHEIGRCNLEIGNYDMAKSYGERSFEMAEKINDDNWKKNSTILIAQSEAKMGDEENLKRAIVNFEKALEYTEKENDTAASRAIKVALAECREKLQKRQGNTPRASDAEKTVVVKSQTPPPAPKPKESIKKPATPPPVEAKPKSPIDYEVHVKTAADISSGTDAKVFISLFGDSGELLDLALRNDKDDLFERDRTDTFVLKKLTDIGKLKKIKIGHDGEKQDSSWKLEHVKVYYNNTAYTFKANRWIDSDMKEDKEKYASIELESGAVDANVSRYEVHVKTADEVGAGTDANVFVTVKGDAGELTGLEMRNYVCDQKANLFEQDSLDKFVILAKDIGKIQKLTVWHDGKGFGSAWILEHVKIVTKDGTTYMFDANKKKIEKDKLELVPGEKKSSVDEAQNKRPMGGRATAAVVPAPAVDNKSNNNKPTTTNLIDYDIHVKTADEMSAGTDSNVFVTLVGEKGELPNMQLKNPERKSLFEKASLDSFVLDKLVDIGKLKKIKIGHDGESKGSSWKLDYVRVFYNNTVYNFKANRWLDIEFKPATDKYVSIELEPSEVETNVKRYEMHVKTADDTGAGTNSNVFVSLKGASGELANVNLNNYVVDSVGKDVFEQDQLDKFVFYMKDIGKIQKLTIWHDGKGFGSSWKLENVKVTTNGTTYVFNANKWIEKNKLELTPN